MPPTVKTSLCLLILCWVLAIPFALADPGRVTLPSDPWMVATLVALALFAFAPLIFLVYATYRGYTWGRWAFAIFCVVGWGFHMPRLIALIETSTMRGLFDLALNIGVTVAVALLFTPASNQWYQARRNAAAT
jgi:hypothetical protein